MTHRTKIAALLFILIFTLGVFWNSRVGSPAQSDEFSQQQQHTLVAVGDILLSRHVGTRIDQSQNPNLPFEKVQDLLKEADLTFGNLECPLSDSGVPVREGLVFRCLVEYVPGLQNAGFDVLSTANNHSFDQGEGNIQFTIDHLLEKGMLPVGTGNTQTGQVIERDGVRFGFLAYSYTAKNDGGRSTDPLVATWDDLAKVKKSIENLKQISDIVLVSLHAGIEYRRAPTDEQIEFARLAVDSGADAVIGHHPHWIQTIEIYKNKPIFYSLGNFVFDQEWSQDTKEGLAVQLTFNDSQLKLVELVPVVIENFCCPRLADEKEKQEILNKIDMETSTIYFE